MVIATLVSQQGLHLHMLRTLRLLMEVCGTSLPQLQSW